MSNFTVFVDSSPLPNYDEQDGKRRYLGVTVATALDCEGLKDYGPRQLWTETSAVMRPWYWEWEERFALVKIEKIDDDNYKAELKEGIITRLLPQAPPKPGPVKVWLDDRFSAYWAQAHSRELSILIALTWPTDRRDIRELVKAARALGLYEAHKATLDDLLEEPVVATARMVLANVLGRLAKRLEEKYQPAATAILALASEDDPDDFRELKQEAVKALIEIDPFAYEANAVKDLQWNDADQKPPSDAVRALVKRFEPLYPEIVALLAPLATAPDEDLFEAGKMTATAYFVGRNERLRKSACFQFSEDGEGLEPADVENTPHSMLGFVANLTNVMAPIPQIGTLAHVVHGNTDDLPDDGSQFALIPIAKIGSLAITRKAVDDACKVWADGDLTRAEQWEQRLFVLPIKIDSSTVTVRSATPKGFQCKEEGLHQDLWAERVELTLGATSRYLRETVSSGLDLTEPLLRGLNTLAVVPDPSAAFAWSARVARDHICPTIVEGKDTIQRLLDATGADITTDLAKAVRNTYRSFHTSVTRGEEWARVLARRAPRLREAWSPSPFRAEANATSKPLWLETERSKAWLVAETDAMLTQNSAVLEMETTAGWRRFPSETVLFEARATEKTFRVDVSSCLFSETAGLRWGNGRYRLLIDVGEPNKPNWQSIGGFAFRTTDARRMKLYVEDGFPRTALNVAYSLGDTAWTVSSVKLVVESKASAVNAELQYWESAGQKWVTYTTALPDTDVAFELDLSAVARGEGLRAGRHQVVSAEKKVVSRFVLGADDWAIQSVQALVTLLSNPDEHADLVMELLDEALRADATASDWLTKNRARLRDEIVPELATRAAIREDNLRAAIIAAMLDFAETVIEFWGYLKETLGSIPDGIFTILTAEIERHATTYIQESNRSRIGPTSVPAPFEISLAGARQDPGDDDPLATLAGAGVLLRREGDVWRCLNAAKLVGIEDRVVGVAALPMAYADGVTVLALTYEGVPIAISPPTADPDAQAVDESVSGEALAQVASYELALFKKDTEAEWTRPPLLAYGRKYDAAGFFIHQSGALPKGLARPDAPWLMKDSPEVKAYESATYQRTTPIGPPRLSMSKDAAKPTPFSALKPGRPSAPLTTPENVHLLARSLPRLGLTVGGPPRRFFTKGARGILALDDGPWTLTIEGIEPRGDMASKLEVHLRDQWPHEEDKKSAWLEIKFATEGQKTIVTFTASNGANDKVTAEVSVDVVGTAISIALRVVPADPYAENGKVGLFPSAWPADGRRGTEKPPLQDAAVLEAFTSLSSASMQISTVGNWVGQGADRPVSSVSFAAPRVDTLRGAFAAVEADQASVVLLAKDSALTLDRPDVSFSALPPAVDLEDWDRRTAKDWLEKDPKDQERLSVHRQNARAGYLIGLEWNNDSDNPPVDIGLYDRCVSQLLFEIVPLFAARHEKERARQLGTYPIWKPGQDPFLNGPSYTPAGTVSETITQMLGCAISDVNTELRTTIGLSGEDKVTCRDGELWELVVRPVVTKDDYGLLHDSVSSLLVKLPGREDYVGPPTTVLVETATKELPTFADLRAALSAKVSGRAIAIRHAPGDIAGKLAREDWAWRGRKFAYLYDATLDRQCWRWRGRPLDSYPFEQIDSEGSIPDGGSTPDKYRDFLAWEVQGFGDRDQADYVATSHVLQPFGATDLRKEDLTGDSRAHHWRFRISARSRYAAIIKDRAGQVVSAPGKPTHLNDRWRRAFVPALPPVEIKPPSVRLVLPLTQGDDAGSPQAPPPLLVVLDDPWFDIGGLAETLVVTIEEARGPDKGAWLQEFGPDPIRTGNGWDESAGVDASIEGPIGYSFDPDGSAQRFAHSSFIVALSSKKAPIADWSLAKLRFRRLLRPEGSHGYTWAMPEGDSKKTVDLPVAFDGPSYVDVAVEDGTAALEAKLVFGEQSSIPISVAALCGHLRIHAELIGKLDDRATWSIACRERSGRLIDRSEIEVKPTDKTPRPTVSVTVVPGSGAKVRFNADRMLPCSLSVPSPAIWCQLAADFSRLGPGQEGIHVKDLEVVYGKGADDKGAWFLRRWADGADLVLSPHDPPHAGSKLQTALWAVATERVTDASRRSVERYVGTFEAITTDKATTLRPLDGDGLDSRKHYIFRILEIEYRQDPEKSPLKPTFVSLWPAEKELKNRDPERVSEAEARIVKVSRPIIPRKG